MNTRIAVEFQNVEKSFGPVRVSRALSFRAWNGQLRQPVFLLWPGAVVATAPLEGFLHQRTEMDTLGLDQPESACKAMKG